MTHFTLRDERPGDEDAIAVVTRAAFEHHPHSRQTEAFIVAALRRAGALTLSLVAEVDGRLVGHVAFSPVAVSDGSAGWYGLGPVSVAPDLQRQGIGSALIREGLQRLRALGAQGCALVGEPAYYARFGFKADAALLLPGVPPEYFLSLPLGAARAGGTVVFHPAFEATG